MYQIRLLMFLLFAATFAHCATTKNTNATSQVPETISFAEVGFIGEDILAVTGDGMSKEGLKTPEQKMATAKEAARMDARTKMIEICRGTGGLGCGTVDNFALAGSAIGKDLAGQIKKAKIKRSECKPDGDQIGCKVLMIIEKPGIKKECEQTMLELAK